jgi:outer membrane protein TolC
MAAKKVHLISALWAVASAAMLMAQVPSATAPDKDAPLLTLDDAVSMALNNNRLVKNSALEVLKFDSRVSTARSRRLPQFGLNTLGGQLLHPFDFTFDQGVFGTFPTIGPVPGSQSKIHNPSRFTTYITANADQPITQLYKIGLGIRSTQLGREMALEDVRAERQKIAAEVRNAYFDLVAVQAAVEAASQTVATLEEAQRVTARYRVQETVLRADALEIDARLAKSRYELSSAENNLATNREHLNQLLARDLNTAFRVESFPEDESAGLALEEARRQATLKRPEVREAELKSKQAEVDRRLAKAEYIPDLSLSLRYQGINNVKVLPANVATAGFYLSWEPFDWGRKKNTVAEKTKTVEQSRNSLHETESQVALEVGVKYRKWQESVLLLKSARAGYEAATEQFRVTNIKYKEQAALVKDLLQAQARSAEADFQYKQALSSYWSSLADLRRAMGEE